MNDPVVLLLILCVVALALSAFGFAPTSPKSTGSSATISAIKKDWAEFFSGSTPPKEKIALLQSGTKFTQVIDSQATSPLAKSTSATVSKVVTTSATTAKVTYTILLAGKPALKNQTGTAVKNGGVWKVGTASFCALLALEQTKTTACPSA